MRKLMFSLLITATLVPQAAMAEVKPFDINSPIFKSILDDVKQKDQQGVTNPVDGSQTPTNDAQEVVSIAPQLAKQGCNPAVWASLVNGSRQTIAAKVTRKTEAQKTIDLRKNNCRNLLGRTKYVKDLRDKANSMNNTLLGLIGGALGLSLNTMQQIAQQFNFDPSQFAMAKFDQTLNAQCLNVDKTRNNLFQNLNGTFGSAALNQAASQGAFTVKFDNTSAQPPTNNGNTTNNTNDPPPVGGGKNTVQLPDVQPQKAAPVPQQPAEGQTSTPAPERKNIYQ